MMDRFFTSDLHLGHRLAAQKRGFQSLDEHDAAVFDSLAALPRRSKLWVLGDIAFHQQALQILKGMPSQVSIAVLGNHDKFSASLYLDIFSDVRGALKYQDYWVTHIPIHPQELCFSKGNIHGHIHMNAATAPLPLPYFNVNWDFHRGPVAFEDIDAEFASA